MLRIAIIGASIAGHTVAVSLREKNKNCSLTLITEEPHPLYDRRRLSEYLAGRIEEKDIFLYSEEAYKQNEITFIKENKVIGINTHKGLIYSKDRSNIEYDFLVICSGRSFSLPEIPGIRKSGVFRLYSFADFKGFFTHLISEPVCLVGSNEFAFNLACAIAAKNKEVKLISQINFKHSPPSPKIEIIESQLMEIIGESGAQAVRFKEGKIIGTSLVAFMDGLKSNIEFLKNTDIEVHNDLICVDEGMRTNLNNVFACGSVCSRRDEAPTLKSWDDIIGEGRCLASNLTQMLG